MSSAEKRMLAKAREILISELTFVVGSTEENAEARQRGLGGLPVYGLLVMALLIVAVIVLGAVT